MQSETFKRGRCQLREGQRTHCAWVRLLRLLACMAMQAARRQLPVSPSVPDGPLLIPPVSNSPAAVIRAPLLLLPSQPPPLPPPLLLPPMPPSEEVVWRAAGDLWLPAARGGVKLQDRKGWKTVHGSVKTKRMEDGAWVG